MELSESYLSALPFDVACRILTRLPIEDVLLYWVDPRFTAYFAPCPSLPNPWRVEYRVLPWPLIRRTGYDTRVFGRLVLSLTRQEMVDPTTIRDVVAFFGPLPEATLLLPNLEDAEEEEGDIYTRFLRLLLPEPTTTRFILVRGQDPDHLWAHVSAPFNGRKGVVGSWPFAQPSLRSLAEIAEVSEERPPHSYGIGHFQTDGYHDDDTRLAIISPSAYWFLFEADLGLEDPRRPPGPNNGRLKDKLSVFSTAVVGTAAGRELMVIATTVALIRLSLGDTKGLDLIDKWYWPLFAPYASEAEEAATAGRTGAVGSQPRPRSEFALQLEYGLRHLPYLGAREYRMASGEGASGSVRGLSQRWVRNAVLNSRQDGIDPSFIFMGETMAISELVVAIFPEVERYNFFWLRSRTEEDGKALVAPSRAYFLGTGPIYLEDGTVVERQDIPKRTSRYPM